MTKNPEHTYSSIDIFSDSRGISELLETRKGKFILAKGEQLTSPYDLACDHACKIIDLGWIPKNEKIYIKEELRCDEEILNFEYSYPVCILSEFRCTENGIDTLLCRNFVDIVIGLLAGFNREALYAKSSMTHKHYMEKIDQLAETELEARTKNLTPKY